MDQEPGAQALEEVDGTGAQMPTSVGSMERVVWPPAVAASSPVAAETLVVL